MISFIDVLIDVLIDWLIRCIAAVLDSISFS